MTKANKRIIHTCLRYPPASGGTEKYVYELVERTRHIPERDVRVLTSRMRTHGPVTELPGDLLLDDAPYVQRLHHSATPFIAYPRLQALRYYLGHHRPDIIHGYSFWYQPADVAARYSVRHRIPFIFHPLYYTGGSRQKSIWQLYQKTIGRLTFARAAVVVVISPHEQLLIERAGFPVRRFALIPPGIDPRPYQHQHENPFAERGLGGYQLLAVSRLAVGKGLEDLLHALPAIHKVHPKTHVNIVGEDFGALAGLKALAQSLHITPYVHFWGKLSEAQLIGAYQHADIFVHPSHYEAFGMVLAESLAAKTPVIARNVAAIPYVVPNTRAGLLFNSQSELVAHVNTLLTNTGQRAALGEFGYQYVVQNFTWDQSIQKMLNLYDELG